MTFKFLVSETRRFITSIFTQCPSLNLILSQFVLPWILYSASLYFLESYTQPVCTSLNLILSQFVLPSFISRNPVLLAGLFSQADGITSFLAGRRDAENRVRVFQDLPSLLNKNGPDRRPKTRQPLSTFFPIHNSLLSDNSKLDERTAWHVRQNYNLTVLYCLVCNMFRL
jgi:hypothetical protein